MSFGLYVFGYLVLIGGLTYGATLVHVYAPKGFGELTIREIL
jgi:hypothetical protein